MKCRGCGCWDETMSSDALCMHCWGCAYEFAQRRKLKCAVAMPKATVDAWLEAGAPGRREVGT